MATLRYSTQGAAEFQRQLERCPICQFPMRNGFQLVCEPGVCTYRETPLRYDASRRKRAA